MDQQSRPNAAAPVAIVGAGPVGLALALGLSRYGVRSMLFERNTATSTHSKAPAIHIRTREVLRQWGIEAAFLDAGVLKTSITLHPTVPGRAPLATLDFEELENEADRPGLLILEQSHTERLLLEAVRAHGACDVRFGAEVCGMERGAEEVRLRVREGGVQRTIDAKFVVGCDGASSFVRRALDLPFEGITYALRPMLADVRVEDDRDAAPWPRTLNRSHGLTTAVRLEPGLWRIIGLDHHAQGETVSDEEVRSRVTEVLGDGPFETVWASRFRIHRRASPRFRVGRVLLAGDAAHVHSPVGGLGMNSGIQDAHNLAWKLAYALRGGDTNRLLDAYDMERRAVVVEAVSRYTEFLTRSFLQAPSGLRDAAFFLYRAMGKVPRLRRMNLRRASMIDLSYPMSPLLARGALSAGLRLPNPRLRAPDGSSVRLYDLLPNGPVMLAVSERASHETLVRWKSALPPSVRVDTIRIGAGGYEDSSGLLRRMLIRRDGWIFVRPDTHVAWAVHDDRNIQPAVRRALGLASERTAPIGIVSDQSRDSRSLRGADGACSSSDCR